MSYRKVLGFQSQEGAFLCISARGLSKFKRLVVSSVEL